MKNNYIGSLTTAAALVAGMSLFSMTASAQFGAIGGAPEPAGCPGPPDWYVKRQAEQAAQFGRGGPGARGARGGRGANQTPPGPAPRLPDNPYYGVNAGKPDFGGLAKGMWRVPYIINVETDAHDEKGCRFIYPPFKPAAKVLWEKRYLQDNMKDDPEGFCLPPGVPRMMYTPYPTEIFQMADRILFIYEGGAHVWRIIWMDGRELPKDPNPDFLGYSVGHWEGDTLVVNSSGFNNETWLDASGHPHGEQLKVTERYTRTDMEHMKIEATIDDPEFYTKPWTIVTGITWQPGQELMEYICQENNRDLSHLGAQRGK